MKNIAIASLLGATYGATMGPLPKDNSNWPKAATTSTLAVGANNGDVTEANFKQNSVFIGAFRGFRNGYVTYPTQNVKKWATNDTEGKLDA